MQDTDSTNSRNVSLPHDLDLRACKKCGGNMVCGSREMDFLSLTSHFSCLDCTHKVSLSPGGSSGVYIAVALLASAILSYLLWGHRGGYTGAEIFKTMAMFAVFTSPVMWAAVKVRQYPMTGTREDTRPNEEADKAVAAEPLQKGLTWLDKLRPANAFVGVLMAVAIFLAIAALIGWINFTYFDDKLFG